MKKYKSGLELQSRDVNLVLKNCDDPQRLYHLQEGRFRNPDFEVFGGNHERLVKNYFSGNIPHRSRFQ